MFLEVFGPSLWVFGSCNEIAAVLWCVCPCTSPPPCIQQSIILWVSVRKTGRGEEGQYIQQSTQSQHHVAVPRQTYHLLSVSVCWKLDIVKANLTCSAHSLQSYTHTTCSSDSECGLEWSHGLEVHLQTLLKVGKESVPSWYKDILEEGKEATGTLLVSVSKTFPKKNSYQSNTLLLFPETQNCRYQN